MPLGKLTLGKVRDVNDLKTLNHMDEIVIVIYEQEKKLQLHPGAGGKNNWIWFRFLTMESNVFVH